MLKDIRMENQAITSKSAFLKELKSKLPDFFVGESFDMDKVKRGLAKESVQTELSSGYQLDFVGKNYAKKQTGELSETVVVPNIKHNEEMIHQNSRNLFFTGDNLEVLRHLQAGYENSIDVIYIDPPYNTGSDGFVYPDSFAHSDEKLKAMFGLDEERLSRLKSIQGRATHSAWLTFMYPRLWLAKRLLKDTGVIFVSIDDNEQANLKLLMDEIFGEGQFVANLAIENNPKGRKNGKFVAVSHETLLVYARDFDKALPFENVVRKNKLLKDEYGYYSHGKRVLVGESTNKLAADDNKNYSVYYNGEVIELVTEKIDEVRSDLLDKGYKVYKSIKDGELLENTYSKSKFLELFNTKSLIFKEESIYEKDRNVYKQQKSLIKSSDEWDFKTETAGFVYGEFDSKKLFSMPKNPSFIKMLLKMFGNNSATVLDFFAGSATTADAVMQLNAEDGGNRSYIMVQLDQPTFTTNSDGTESPAKGAEAAYKDGYRYIDQISRERIKRARAKILERNPSFPNFDGGFKHYQVVKPDQKLLEDLDTYDIETGTFMDGSGQINLIGEDYFDDMLTPFSADYLGVEGGALAYETILTTWKLSDGYAVDKKENYLDLAGYPAIQLDNRLYLIEQGWTEEQTKVLVNLLGRRELEVQTIILYGYSFEMTALRELELALSSLDKVVKLIKNY